MRRMAAEKKQDQSIPHLRALVPDLAESSREEASGNVKRYAERALRVNPRAKDLTVGISGSTMRARSEGGTGARSSSHPVCLRSFRFIPVIPWN